MNERKLSPQDEQLIQILKEINGTGVKSFNPASEGIEALKNFQSIACCLKEAKKHDYIEKLVLPSMSVETGSCGFIKSAVVFGA